MSGSEIVKPQTVTWREEEVEENSPRCSTSPAHYVILPTPSYPILTSLLSRLNAMYSWFRLHRADFSSLGDPGSILLTHFV